jgi:hypothetical protein
MVTPVEEKQTPMSTITDPHKKAELAIAYDGSRTLIAQTMTVGNGWGVAPMNWPHCYRIVVDGQATGNPIFAPEGFWAVMDALAADLGIRE